MPLAQPSAVGASLPRLGSVDALDPVGRAIELDRVALEDRLRLARLAEHRQHDQQHAYYGDGGRSARPAGE
jgi:hypothetical protein